MVSKIIKTKKRRDGIVDCSVLFNSCLTLFFVLNSINFAQNKLAITRTIKKKLKKTEFLHAKHELRGKLAIELISIKLTNRTSLSNNFMPSKKFRILKSSLKKNKELLMLRKTS